MKVTIEFDEIEDAKAALNSLKYISAIDETDNYLRSQIKHGDWDEKVYEMLEHARALLRWE